MKKHVLIALFVALLLIVGNVFLGKNVEAKSYSTEHYTISLSKEWKVKPSNSSDVILLYNNKKVGYICTPNLKIETNTKNFDFIVRWDAMHAYRIGKVKITKYNDYCVAKVKVGYELSAAAECKGLSKPKNEMHYYYYNGNKKSVVVYFYCDKIASSKMDTLSKNIKLN